MLLKIGDESYEGNDAVERSKGNVAKAEDTIEAAQKEINVSKELALDILKLGNALQGAVKILTVLLQ